MTGTRRFNSLRVWLIFGLMPGMALAGDCGPALRSLMLQTDPAADRIETVRALCADEAAAGDPDSLYRLSFFLLGFGDWNPDAAIPLILDAANQGVPEAQYWLAWQRETGPLLPDDSEAALRWYQAAARLDHRLALARLARAYEAGEFGLQPDPIKARDFRAAAARCSR